MKNLEKEANKLVHEALEENEKPFISCSFGKDSLVVLDLVRKWLPEIPVIWSNTGVCHPSVYDIVEYYRDKINLIEVNPKCSFWDIVDNYGWPIGARSSGSKKAVSQCCKKLKKEPMAEDTKEYDLEFNGMTAYESWTRYTRLKGYGNYNFVKSRSGGGRNVASIIAWWKVEDVWEYIDKHDIKYPKIYDQETEHHTKLGYKEKVKGVEMDRGCIRVGCWTCPLPLKYSKGVMEQLRNYYPKRWKLLMKKGLADEIARLKLGGQGSLTDGYYTEETRDGWLEQRPCFFDKI